jgi:hypothetical protein
MNGNDIEVPRILDHSGNISSFTGGVVEVVCISYPSLLFLQGPRPRPIIRPRFSGPVPSKFGISITPFFWLVFGIDNNYTYAHKDLSIVNQQKSCGELPGMIISQTPTGSGIPGTNLPPDSVS